jgi:hypothetical protein
VKIFLTKPQIDIQKPDNEHRNTISSSPDRMVWLVFSDLNGDDVVVHGTFTSEEYANRCAEAVGKTYPKRHASIGAWKINETWIALSDRHLK